MTQNEILSDKKHTRAKARSKVRPKILPEDILYIIKLAELGSFHAVGRELSCSPSHVRTRILYSERTLGMPLFTKAPKLPGVPPRLQPPRFKVNEAGAKLLPFMHYLQDALLRVTTEALKLRVVKKKAA